MSFTKTLLTQVLETAPQSDEGSVVLSEANFEGALFNDTADFSGVIFEGIAVFSKAYFSGDARFVEATFQRYAGFNEATFKGRVWLDGVTFEGQAGFEQAIFESDTGFNRATFERDASFRGATIQDSADFDGATFAGDASFCGATFHDVAGFVDATVEGDAEFEGATFDREARFNGATFAGDALFFGATFHDVAEFVDATVAGDAGFEMATFQDIAGFPGARFVGNARFNRVTFEGDALFVGATFQDAMFSRAAFERARELGPMLVHGTLVLDDAVFRERAQIAASAKRLVCRRIQFPAGVHLRVRWAETIFEDADMAAPSILSAAPLFDGLDEIEFARTLQADRGISDVHGRPRLLSVQRADVSGLTVAGVDMRACRFVGAHNLDRLRVDESEFGWTPKAWWRTARRTIAEEHQWRSSESDDGSQAWYGRMYQPTEEEDAPLAPAPSRVAAVYRELRKGREDSKDEPGAADFYYGEMQMRRLASRTGLRAQNRQNGEIRSASRIINIGEHVILTLYWMLSGYGLRAWRALVALTTLVLAGGLIFAFWGYAPSDDAGFVIVAVDDEGSPVYGEADPQAPSGIGELPGSLRFSAQAATSLLRGTDESLTAVGEWLHLGLRLVGPILLGLAVLSIRGRVKR